MKLTLGIKRIVLKLKSEGCSARRITMEAEKCTVLKFLIKQLANFRVKLLGTDSLTCATNYLYI